MLKRNLTSIFSNDSHQIKASVRATLGAALLLLRPQLPRKMRPRGFLFTGSPNFLINCMTISDYNRKPVRRDRAIFF